MVSIYSYRLSDAIALTTRSHCEPWVQIRRRKRILVLANEPVACNRSEILLPLSNRNWFSSEVCTGECQGQQSQRHHWDLDLLKTRGVARRPTSALDRVREIMWRRRCYNHNVIVTVTWWQLKPNVITGTVSIYGSLGGDRQSQR